MHEVHSNESLLHAIAALYRISLEQVFISALEWADSQSSQVRLLDLDATASGKQYYVYYLKHGYIPDFVIGYCRTELAQQSSK